MGNTPIWPADARFRCIGTYLTKQAVKCSFYCPLDPLFRVFLQYYS